MADVPGAVEALRQANAPDTASHVLLEELPPRRSS
jgi:hypothetical protein